MTGSRSAEHRRAVKAGLTPGGVRRVVQNDEFTAFARRVLRTLGRRVAAGDVEALPALARLAADLDDSIGDAVAGLRAGGYSWTEIAARLGVSKQAAHQRWSTPVPTGSTSTATSAGRGVA